MTNFTGICCGGPKDGQWLSSEDRWIELVTSAAPDYWTVNPGDPVEYRRVHYRFGTIAISGRGGNINVPIWEYQGKPPTALQSVAAIVKWNTKQQRRPIGTP
jgi:hypothetical protein